MSDLIPLMSLEELARTQLSQELNGSLGLNREISKRCLIEAKDDVQAIERWLAEYAHRPTTERHYRKDAERLLLWSIIEKRKPLSSLTGEDLLAYSHFLENPTPAEKWCGPKLARKAKRWSSGWKPFVGPLGLSTKQTALRNLGSLFHYLERVNYLAHNPFISVKRQLIQKSDTELQHEEVQKKILEEDQWQAVLTTLTALPETYYDERWEKIRLKFILALLYFGCLRVNELCVHTMGDFKKSYDSKAQKERWWLFITGKGNKLKRVPVNEGLLTALKEYRRFLNLSELPQPDEAEPLVKSLETKKSLSTRRVNQLLKTLAHQASLCFVERDLEKAEKLQKLSAHWLRHISCSNQAKAEIDRYHIRDAAGHKNVETTERHYIHTQDYLRHDDMEKLGWTVK